MVRRQGFSQFSEILVVLCVAHMKVVGDVRAALEYRCPTPNYDELDSGVAKALNGYLKVHGLRALP
jgi:hypothetical protein